MKNISFLFLLFLGIQFVTTAQIKELPKLPKPNRPNTSLAVQPSSDMSYYLKIEGIDGICTESTFLHWIPLRYIELNMTKSLVENRVTGKANMVFWFVKNVDYSSVELLRASFRNQTFPKVELACTQTIGGKKVKLFTYEFRNVRLGTILQDESYIVGTLTDKVQLGFDRLIMTYYQYDANGNLKTTNEAEIGYSNI